MGRALKARLSPDAPFGIGLRLSGDESRELLEDDRLRDFRAWLDGEGLYVFTINGFPHGTFHGQPVKADVHAPDWQSDERVAYTLRLAEILSALLPDGVEGTISTSPLSYKAWDYDLDACTAHVLQVGEELRGTGIALAIEPEADGTLATVDELIEWWPDGLENVTVCFDACHSAVAYEEPEEALAALDEAGIRIGKAQLSAALRLPVIARAELERFADPIYLHQVTQRSADGSLQSWPDLPEALDGYGGGEEWRVHFHVPIFLERYGAARVHAGPPARGDRARARPHVAPGDRDLHVGRPAAGPEGLVGRLDRARVRVGARCPPLRSRRARPPARGCSSRGSRTRRPSSPTRSPAPCWRRPSRRPARWRSWPSRWRSSTRPG